MEKYITNIRDLVIQYMTNGKEIERKAENGDAMSCFQMGMIYLLGIQDSVDFKKAAQFFEEWPLANDSDAKLMLGFIAEHEGRYSSAFEYYADAIGGESKQSYIEKVIKERHYLQTYLKKLAIPIVLNSEISAVLDNLTKKGDLKVDASIKIAMICDDQPSCILAAQSLCEAGDYYSAYQWLQSGKVLNNNLLYATIEKNMKEPYKGLNLSPMIELIDLDGNELLTDFDTTSPYANTKETCNEVASANKLLWIDLISKMISDIKLKFKEEEARRKKEEEEARKRREEAEAQRKKEEEARRRSEEEEARKRREEEEARRKKEEEEARRRREEEEAQRRKKEEEELLLEKKKKANFICNIIMICAYVGFLMFICVGQKSFEDVVTLLMGGLTCSLIPALGIWFFIRFLINDHYKKLINLIRSKW